jgi:hypothetical protein
MSPALVPRSVRSNALVEEGQADSTTAAQRKVAAPELVAKKGRREKKLLYLVWMGWDPPASQTKMTSPSPWPPQSTSAFNALFP